MSLSAKPESDLARQIAGLQQLRDILLAEKQALLAHDFERIEALSRDKQSRLAALSHLLSDITSHTPSGGSSELAARDDLLAESAVNDRL